MGHLWHDSGNPENDLSRCTAPSAEDYIAELQAALEASGNVTAEMLARMREQSAVLAEALRERDTAKKCAERRKSALRHTGKKGREAYWQLREKLASVEEDSALLDWLETNIQLLSRDIQSIDGQFFIYIDPEHKSPAIAIDDDLRAAIRAAMEAGK